MTPLHPASLGWSLALLSTLLLLLATLPALSTPLRFAYNCFVKPIISRTKHDNQSDKLDAFYKGQADVYDTTRAHLLKGRENMLQLMASHLKAQPISANAHTRDGAGTKPKIWVDIGGGTGWNIEKM